MPFFKSAFGHSLRTSPPSSLDEYYEHMLAAVLGGAYNLTISKDTSEAAPAQAEGEGEAVASAEASEKDAENMVSIRMNLPTYDSNPEAPLKEGIVTVEDGVTLENSEEKLKGLVAETYPAKVLTELSPGLLQAFYTFANSWTERLRSDANKEAVTTLKRSTVKLLAQAFQNIGKAMETVEGRNIFVMDPILAEAETFLLTSLKDNEVCSAELKGYFEVLLQMHAALVTDEAEPEQPHQHSHEGGCCGGH